MAKVGAQRAAVLTGRSKSTIQRAMNSGKLSYEIDQNDRRVIDVSELERVFGIKQTSLQSPAVPATIEAAAPVKTVEQAVEKEHMSMRIKMLEQQLQTANDYIDDLKDQRDKWEKQASQVLITSQYSQRQAEELREQIRKREERARQRRQQIEGGFKTQAAANTPAPAQQDAPAIPLGDQTGEEKSAAAQKTATTMQAEQQKKRDVRRLEEQMQKLKAQNENENDAERDDLEAQGQSVFRFWKRVKG